MEEISKPNYYAIIPAEVRYAKIPPNAKLLYGEITALCSKEGFCWASNEYFANLYEVSHKTISLWIRVLKYNNFIDYKLSQNYLRKIYIVMGVLQKGNGGITKMTRGVLQKGNNSNTVNNTDSNTIKKRVAFAPPSLEEVKKYCEERKNTINPQSWIDFYESKGWMIGKNKMKSWKAAVRTWEGRERQENKITTISAVVEKKERKFSDLKIIN